MVDEHFQTLAELFQTRAEDAAHGLIFLAGQSDRQRVSYAEHSQAAQRLLGLFQSRGARTGDSMILHIGDNRRFLEAFWACVLGGIVPVPVAGGISDEHRRKLFRIHARLDAPWLFTEPAAFERLGKYAVGHALDEQHAALGERAFLVDEAFLATAVQHEPGVIHTGSPDDTAFIQFSSGSTSDPKGIVLTHRNLLTNLAAIRTGMAMVTDEVMLSWMPLTHDMGLIGFHLTPVFGSIDHVLMPTDLFVRRPAMWLTATQDYRASVLCSPNFGYEHLLKSFNVERHVELDLSSVRLIFNGAEPISAALCDRFMHTFEHYGLHQDAMMVVYGLAEASLAVSFPEVHAPFLRVTVARGPMGVGDAVHVLSRHRGPQPVAVAGDASGSDVSSQESGLTFVGEGTPVDDCEVRLVGVAEDAAAGDGAAEVPECTVGRVLIRGGNVTRGYFREEALNAKLISADGWLDTGDLGFRLDGQLFITGRGKDLMFLNGQNVYPHDLENIAIEAGLAEAGKIALVSSGSGIEQVLCFVQHRGEMAPLAKRAVAIGRLINEAAGVRVHQVVPVQRLPKTTSGKVQRFLLVQNYQRGEYDAGLGQLRGYLPAVPTARSDTAELSGISNGAGEVDQSGAVALDTVAAGTDDNATKTQVSTLDTLHELCQSQIDELCVGLDDNLFEIGISSLTLAQIHEQIDRTWPDAVDVTDLFDYPTIRSLAGLLEARFQTR